MNFRIKGYLTPGVYSEFSHVNIPCLGEKKNYEEMEIPVFVFFPGYANPGYNLKKFFFQTAPFEIMGNVGHRWPKIDFFFLGK